MGETTVGMGCHFLLQIQGSNPRLLHLLHGDNTGKDPELSLAKVSA